MCAMAAPFNRELSGNSATDIHSFSHLENEPMREVLRQTSLLIEYSTPLPSWKDVTQSLGFIGRSHVSRRGFGGCDQTCTAHLVPRLWSEQAGFLLLPSLPVEVPQSHLTTWLAPSAQLPHRPFTGLLVFQISGCMYSPGLSMGLECGYIGFQCL